MFLDKLKLNLALMMCILYISSGYATDWHIPAGIYQHTMSINAEIRKNGDVDPLQENWEVGVFDISGNCRGIQKSCITSSGRKHFPIMVYGNVDGENLIFKARSLQQPAQEIEFDQRAKFEADFILGQGAFFVLSEAVQLEPSVDESDPRNLVIYISPEGSASGSSIDKPTNNITKALAVLEQATGWEQKTLVLKAGDYVLNEPIRLVKGIHLKAYEQDIVRLSGRKQHRVLESDNASRSTMNFVETEPSVYIRNLIIQDGFSEGNGGGAYVGSDVMFEDCIFQNNVSLALGGGLFGGNAQKTLFQDNKATVGGSAAAHANLEYTTVVRNISEAYIPVLQQVNLRNSIVWGNQNNSVVGGGELAYSALEGDGHSGVNLVKLSGSNTEDQADKLAPRFVNVGSLSADWHLSNGSPLSKLIDNTSDLGAFQSNKKGIAFFKLTLPTDRISYGEVITPIITLQNAFGQPLTQLAAGLEYRRKEGAQWLSDFPKDCGLYEMRCYLPAHDTWEGYSDNIVTASFEIVHREITLRAKETRSFYGESEKQLEYDIEGELVKGDNIAGSLSRENPQQKGAGRYAIEQGSLRITDNYKIRYEAADYMIEPRPVVVKAQKTEKLYFSEDPTFAYTVEFPENSIDLSGMPIIEGDQLTGALCVNNSTLLTSVGQYPITQGTLALNENYRLIYEPDSLHILPRQLKIKPRFTRQQYGAEEVVIGYDVEGELVNGNTLTGNLTRECSSEKNVGKYTIEQGTLQVYQNHANYEISLTPEVYEIYPAIVEITAHSKEKVYGDNDPELTYAITSGRLYYDDFMEGQLSRLPGNQAGKYSIGQGSLSLNNNYVINYIPAPFTIQPRNITVKADDITVKYGDDQPELTYQITGTLVYDDLFTGTLRREVGIDAGSYAILQGNLGLSANYNLNFEQGNYLITPREVTLRAKESRSFYGETEKQLEYEFEGELVKGDHITGSLSRENPQQKGAGRYAIGQGSLRITDNYKIRYEAADYMIEPRPVVVKAQKTEKLYFSEDPTFAYTVEFPENSIDLSGMPIIEGDQLTGALCVNNSTLLTSVGQYPITQGTLALNENYRLIYEPETLHILPRQLKIKPRFTRQQYGAEEVVIGYDVEGELVNGNTLTGNLTRERSFEKNVGKYTIEQGTLQVYQNHANYEIALAPEVYEIYPAIVEITAHSKEKVYGDNDPELTYAITSGRLYYDDFMEGKLSRLSGNQVGKYSIEQGSVSLSNNYVINYIPAPFTIQPRNITVKADDITVKYGDEQPELTYQITGTLAYDDIFTGTLRREVGIHVGSYAIHQGSLGLSANYNLGFEQGNYLITPRHLSVKIENTDKIYGEDDPEYAYHVGKDGLVNSDLPQGSLSRISGEDVGAYDIEMGTLQFSSDYVVDFVEKGALQIYPKEIDILVDGLEHIYDRQEKEVRVTTVPGNIPVRITYNGTEEKPVVAGEYDVEIICIDKNHVGEYSAKMVISDPLIGKSIPATRYVSKSKGHDSGFDMEFEELALDSKITFFNVKGKVVFEKTNYRSGDFIMGSLPVGTYYYVYKFTNSSGEQCVQKDYVEVIP